MAVQALESDFPNDRLPLLRWLMFTGVCVFGFVLVWYFGLFRLMLASDKTYISAIIVALYLGLVDGALAWIIQWALKP